MAEIDPYIELERFRTSLDENTAQIKETNKIYKSIQKSLDLIYNDRDLIKDVYEQGGGIKTLILALEKHFDVTTKDIGQKIVDTQDKVEEKAEETKDTIEHHTGNIADTIETKRVIAVSQGKSLIRRIFRR